MTFGGTSTGDPTISQSVKCFRCVERQTWSSRVPVSISKLERTSDWWSESIRQYWLNVYKAKRRRERSGQERERDGVAGGGETTQSVSVCRCWMETTAAHKLRYPHLSLSLSLSVRALLCCVSLSASYLVFAMNVSPCIPPLSSSLVPYQRPYGSSFLCRCPLSSICVCASRCGLSVPIFFHLDEL